MPLIQEFGYTGEIDDRALWPLLVGLVALAKVIAAALQGLLAALVVFPLKPDLAHDLGFVGGLAL
jgi:ABC-2 type transport system permease protein